MLKKLIPLIVVLFSFGAVAEIKPNTVYKGIEYTYGEAPNKCQITIGSIQKNKKNEIVSFTAKAGKYQKTYLTLKKIENGFYSNAPKGIHTEDPADLNAYEIIRTFGHLFLGTTLNVGLDQDGNLEDAEYFGRFSMKEDGHKEYLCNFIKK